MAESLEILLVEDDIEQARHLVASLEEQGHSVTHVENGIVGLRHASTARFDVLIVDRMLPGLDGLSLIEKMRADSVTTPTLILSALGQVDDRVKGLRAGGDDYVTKPYSFPELLARVEVLARRRDAPNSDTTLKCGDLVLDRINHVAVRDGQKITLQPREYRLLEYLMRNAGRLVTRSMLLESVWDLHFDPQTNVIDVHVSRLRAKIDKGFETPLLQTIRGKGYQMQNPANDS
ncbi:MAG: response regulator transcription factor [Pseudomonadota bacterium]